MITLLIDGLIALVKAVDRLFPKRASHPVNSPLTVERDAQPAGADLAAGSGGTPSWHPASWTDSELLTAAAEWLLWIDSHPGVGPASRQAATNVWRELNRRAAKFRAVND